MNSALQIAMAAALGAGLAYAALPLSQPDEHASASAPALASPPGPGKAVSGAPAPALARSEPANVTVANFLPEPVRIIFAANPGQSVLAPAGQETALKATAGLRLKAIRGERVLCEFPVDAPNMLVEIEPPAEPSWIARRIDGFDVRFSPAVFADGARFDKAMSYLERKTRDILFLVPAGSREALRHVRLWVERDVPSRAAGLYVNSPFVQQSHQERVEVRPFQYRSIVFPSVEGMMSWGDRTNVVIHEYAHALHHQVLGRDNGEIYAAYKNALDRGLYRNVKTDDGKSHPFGYGLTNQYEYFAVLSETYLHKNAVFPFNKFDLAAYDPQGFSVVERAWAGTLPRPPRAARSRCASGGWKTLAQG